jgi:hypothetical protein
MPKKDIFHDCVKNALSKQGWEITFDPLFIPTEGGVNFFIDLGIEKIIGAKKNGQNIAVEIKSFDAVSPFYGFYEILGQYLMYQLALETQKQVWQLYIAIPILGYKKLEAAPIFRKALKKYQLKFIIFNPTTQTVIQWKN